MKNIKAYRAATLREALERIKLEVGAEALVHSHKKVKVGGIFGFGAQEMVEVLASAKPGPASAPRPESPNPPAGLPRPSAASAPEPASPVSGLGLSAFAARAYTNTSALTGAAPPGKGDAAPRSERPEPVAEANRGRTSSGIRVEPRSEPSVVETESKIPQRQPLNGGNRPAPPAGTALTGSSITRELLLLRSELREIKFTLGTINPSGRLLAQEPAAAESGPAGELYDSPYYEMFLELAGTGLSPEQARTTIQQAITVVRHIGQEGLSLDHIARLGLKRMLLQSLEFSSGLPVLEDGARPAPTILLGPTGVGKTTTIAKLAAECFLTARRRVELVTLDTYRIAAVDQLKTYAEIIGAGCQVARSVAELEDIIRRTADTTCLFIDTVGRSPNDLADQMQLADFLRNNRQLNKCLVLQATFDQADAQNVIRKYGLFGPTHLIVTKVDETSRPGRAVETAIRSGLPLAYLGTGQRVPEDLEAATPDSLVKCILRAVPQALAA